MSDSSKTNELKDTDMKNLQAGLEQVKLEDPKLNSLIQNCNQHLANNDRPAALTILNQLLQLAPTNPSVTSLARAILQPSNTTNNLDLVKTLLNIINLPNLDDSDIIKSKKDAIAQLVTLTDNTINKDFQSSFLKLDGIKIMMNLLIEMLEIKNQNEFVLSTLKVLTNLSKNTDFLSHLIDELNSYQPSLTTLKSLDSEVILGISDLFRNVIQHNIVDNKLISKYLDLIHLLCEKFEFNTLKVGLLHVIQLSGKFEFDDQLVKSGLFEWILSKLMTSSQPENRGLGIILLTRVQPTQPIEPLISLQYTKLKDNIDPINLLNFINGIYQYDPNLGYKLLDDKDWLDELVELIEFNNTEIVVGLVDLLGLACRSKEGRKLVKETSTNFLIKCNKNQVEQIKAGAILVQSKLAIDSPFTPSSIKDLILPIIAILAKGNLNQINYAIAIESLTYFTIQPPVRQLLVDHPKLFISLVECGLNDQTPPATLYGLSAIISNVVTYKKILNKDQAQLKKLKKMAKDTENQEGAVDEDDPLMEDNKVKLRNQFILSIPKLPSLLVKMANTKKESIWTTLALTYNSLTRDPKNHGILFKYATVKALLLMTSSENGDVAVCASQGLSKLAIHTDPNLAFPNQQAFELIRPLANLLNPTYPHYSNSTLLHQFEALMALTNLSSISPQHRIKIYQSKILSQLEILMLHSNHMIARASTELLCNMCMTEQVYNLYTQSNAKSKIHTLIALSDGDDEPTRIAASGSLCTLTNHPNPCKILLQLPITRSAIWNLIDPKSPQPFQHRGIEILKNLILQFIEDKTFFQGLNIHELLIDEPMVNRLLVLQTKSSNFQPIQDGLATIFKALENLD